MTDAHATPGEMTIIKAFVSLLDSLPPPGLMGRGELWQRVYALAPCTEAEFMSAMDAFERVLVAVRTRPKRAALSVVR